MYQARFRLKQYQQKANQTIVQFYLECRELVRDCQYGNIDDELLLGHPIFKIKDDKLRERAIEEERKLKRFLEVASKLTSSCFGLATKGDILPLNLHYHNCIFQPKSCQNN